MLKNLSRLNWSNKNMLVAEDEFSNFLFIKELLETTQINIIHVINGIDAIKNARSNNIDIILMDIKMPDMDGLEATKQIREFNKNIPIIAQTAYAFSEDKRKCLLAGCNHYISKPLDPEKLLELIQMNISN